MKLNNEILQWCNLKIYGTSEIETHRSQKIGLKYLFPWLIDGYKISYTCIPIYLYFL